MDFIVDIGVPLLLIVREMDRGRASLPFLYYVWSVLEAAVACRFQHHPKIPTEDKLKILEIISNAWVDYYYPAMGAAYVLNPHLRRDVEQRMKEAGDEWTKLWQDTIDTIVLIIKRTSDWVSNFAPEDDTGSGQDAEALAHSRLRGRVLQEFNIYFMRPVESLVGLSNTPAIVWWALYSHWIRPDGVEESILRQAALRLFAIIPSASDVERYHKNGSAVHSITRNKLAHDDVVILSRGRALLRQRGRNAAAAGRVLAVVEDRSMPRAASSSLSSSSSPPSSSSSSDSVRTAQTIESVIFPFFSNASFEARVVQPGDTFSQTWLEVSEAEEEGLEHWAHEVAAYEAEHAEEEDTEEAVADTEENTGDQPF